MILNLLFLLVGIGFHGVESMALPSKETRAQNVAGNLFVDESCIDCDVCRWMCPNVFSRKGIKSAVTQQPLTDDDKLSAYAAMVACPVGSIRTHQPDPLVKDAIDLFPAEIDPINIPGVMHLGFHSKDSYGATPYFIKRSEKLGNIMIDTPRFNTKLADNIELEGGLKYIILTHKDDVVDHDKWKNRFPDAQRIIHSLDISGKQGTNECELILEGISLLTDTDDNDDNDDNTTKNNKIKTWQPDDGLLLLHTPGHTPGSICVVIDTKYCDSDYASSNNNGDVVLFTGDHLAFSQRKGSLTGFQQYNKGSLEVQALSLEMLANLLPPSIPRISPTAVMTSNEVIKSPSIPLIDNDLSDSIDDSDLPLILRSFTWILPGHGRFFKFSSYEQRKKLLQEVADDVRVEDPLGGFLLGYQ